ncbi:MAG: glycoside hydrolase family 3 C-terminal domain-containing protein [Verrucomicrobia bacterium]|nr:glycoside hydrolase family 3 C-terminal domain-containing protein [Verrucomicrobiota bacterium]
MIRHASKFLLVLWLAHTCFGGQARTPMSLPMPPTEVVAPPPPPPPPLIYPDPDRPIAERVADLISRMTLEEKVSQLDMEPPAIKRLNIPTYSWWSEGIHGVSRAGRATMFPQTIAMAATWNEDLVEHIATVVSDEARVKHRESPTTRYHGLTYWAPAVDLVRDPRWGRIMETYGEDPYMVSRFGLRFIHGLQGDDPKYLKTAATVKHFAAHSQETRRESAIFTISPRALREYYFPTFQICITEGHAASLMTAHNGVNGVPCVSSSWLLKDILRQEWGFNGPIVTDYMGPIQLNKNFKITDTYEKSLAMTISAGVDIFSHEGALSHTNTLKAVQSGLITEAQVNQALTRGLTLRFVLGMFDPPQRVPYTQIPESVLGSVEHVALALETSRQSLVLLKNQPIPGRADSTAILPLDRQKLESIAVVGLYGNRIQFGTYVSEPAAPPVTVLRGIMNRVGDRLVVRHEPWYEPEEKKKKKEPPPDQQTLMNQKVLIEAAVKAAALSDVAIVALGLGEKNEFESKDRLDLDLPKNQQEFVEKIVAVNPATVVVLINGGPLSVNWLQQHVPAIIEAWYPGEQGGNAIAEVLFGDYNPAGRLPMTFYSSLEQVPPLDDYEISHGRTYMYFTGTPLYPFGYGLSYTRFEYSNLGLDRVKAATNDMVNVRVNIKNVGNRDGDEVVQMYVRDMAASVPVPIKQLRGFKRIHLPQGQTQSVTWPVKVADLGFWDEEHHRWVVEPGQFEVQIGASSSDIRQHTTFDVQ